MSRLIAFLIFILLVLLALQFLSNFVTIRGYYSTDEESDLPKSTSKAVNAITPKATAEPYPMSKPILNGKVYGNDDAGIDVFWAQTQLRTLGYYNKSGYEVTGCMGTRTISELKRFQKNYKLSNRSGTLDQDTVDQIATAQAQKGIEPQPVYIGGFYNDTPIIPKQGLQKGDKGDAVVWVQQRLYQLGYYTDAIDGDFGDKTAKAVKAFQKACGLTQTGLVKLGVLRGLAEACNR